MASRLNIKSRYTNVSERVVYILEFFKPFFRLAFMIGLLALLYVQESLTTPMLITLGILFVLNPVVFGLVIFHKKYIQLKIISYFSILMCLSLFSVLVLSTGGIKSHFYLAFFFYIALVPLFQQGFRIIENLLTALGIILTYNSLVIFDGVASEDWSALIIRNFFFILLTAISGISGKIQSIKKEKVDTIYSDLQDRNYEMTNDLKMAQMVQAAIIPRIFPESDLVDFDGRYLPMEELGGDYYDVFRLSDSKFGMVIADVSGHGVAAALVMIMAKMSFATNAKADLSAGDTVTRVNEELWGSIGDVDRYLTAFYGIIDTENQVIDYSSAGHNDVLVLKQNGEIIPLHSNATVIGISDEIIYPSDSYKLDTGDRIIMYTDGIIETRNEEGEFLGDEKFYEFIKKHEHLPSGDLVHNILWDVAYYNGNAPVDDDRTILIAGVGGARTGSGVDFNMASATPERELKLHLDQAVKNYKLGNYDKALTSLTELDGKNPENARILKLIGYVHYKTGKYEEASNAWKKSLAIDPSNKDLQRNIEILDSKSASVE